MEHRPPSYLSCASLARELDVSERTVTEMVGEACCPPPLKLSSGCVRWCWSDVQVALGSLAVGGDVAEDDPFMEGGARCRVAAIGRRDRAPRRRAPRHLARARIFLPSARPRNRHAGPRIRLPDDPHSSGVLERRPPGAGHRRPDADRNDQRPRGRLGERPGRRCRESSAPPRRNSIGAPSGSSGRHGATCEPSAAAVACPGAHGGDGRNAGQGEQRARRAARDVPVGHGAARVARSRSDDRAWCDSRAARGTSLGRRRSSRSRMPISPGCSAGPMCSRATPGSAISDVVRLGFTDIDEGGFALPQKKTGVRPWCPIFPELEAEMATWERRPGPFLLPGQRTEPFTHQPALEGVRQGAGGTPASSTARCGTGCERTR